MAIEAGEIVVCSELGFVRQDQAAVLSDADIACLDAVLKGSGVVQSHNFQGLAVDDLTATKGSGLAASKTPCIAALFIWMTAQTSVS